MNIELRLCFVICTMKPQQFSKLRFHVVQRRELASPAVDRSYSEVYEITGSYA